VPVAITGLAAGLTIAAGGSAAALPGIDWVQIAATFGSTVIIVGLFEEVGWRGYALPRLQQRMTNLRAALVLGGIWAIWHLPELVSDPTRQRPVVPFLILVVAQSVFLSRLYNGTAAGLPVVIISHAAMDTAARFVLPQFAGPDYQMVWWSLAGIWTAAAIVAAATAHGPVRTTGAVVEPSSTSGVRPTTSHRGAAVDPAARPVASTHRVDRLGGQRRR
jgi:membrane protease YdiL (CAAX protease family)